MSAFDQVRAHWVGVVERAELALSTSDGDRYRLSRHRQQLKLVVEQLRQSAPRFLSQDEVNEAAHIAEDIARRLDESIAHALDHTVTSRIVPASLVSVGRGRPRVELDLAFLSEAVDQYRLGPSRIAQLVFDSTSLHVLPRTVRRRLLEAGVRAPEDRTTRWTHLPGHNWDELVARLWLDQPDAGTAELLGRVNSLGFFPTRAVLVASMRRLNPFPALISDARRSVRTRDVYRVAGPNSVWHHDGQHKLIMYGIVVHGFINGYSRLVTALQASSNNRAATVLRLFLKGASEYGVPSRVRGDRGGENVQVAYWMTEHRGTARGSYLWGTSPHNTRIERLWPEVKRLVLERWHRFFHDLVEQGEYSADLPSHVWLGTYLFLGDINLDLENFRNQHNLHPVSTERNRRPLQIFWEGMHTQGVRGLDLNAEEIQGELDRVALEEEALATLRSTETNEHVDLGDHRLPWPLGMEEEAMERMAQEMEGRWTQDHFECWLAGRDAMYTVIESLEL